MRTSPLERLHDQALTLAGSLLTADNPICVAQVFQRTCQRLSPRS
jgi:hypothetical protein